jgi:hypothetical protein
MVLDETREPMAHGLNAIMTGRQMTPRPNQRSSLPGASGAVWAIV